MIRDTARRTTCDCEACQVGCRTMPGMCSLPDVERITDYVAPDDREKFITEHFVASEGAKVARIRDNGSVAVFDIPTITPAQRPDGTCVFYNREDGTCGVHPVSPLGCACVDTHLTRAEGDAVLHPALAELAADKAVGGPYLQTRERLVAAGRIARPRAERRAAFERLFAACRPNPVESLDA